MNLCDKDLHPQKAQYQNMSPEEWGRVGWAQDRLFVRFLAPRGAAQGDLKLRAAALGPRQPIKN